MAKILWSPDNQNTQLSQFITYANSNYQLTIEDYPSLHQWSINNLQDFWQAIADFSKVNFLTKPKKIIQLSQRMQDTQWFIGAKLNFAQNLLRHKSDNTAIIDASERGDLKSITFKQLHEQVAKLAQTFRHMGLKPGDRVAAMLPNTSEAVIAMLAATSLGAIWSACSPDFGLEGLLDRFAQINPKILITVDGHFYKGKTFSHQEKNIALLKNLPSVTHTILFNYLGTGSLTGLENSIDWQDCFKAESAALTFEQLPFDHPVYILYSSGTTGKPKCMVHGAGGTLLQHLKEHQLHVDLRAESVIYFNTTVTWMMWHWLVSALSLGATIVLYEGFPFYPKLDSMFSLIDQANINYFGVGAKFFEMCDKSKLTPNKTHSLNSLQCILTTGSPLLPASFDYIYQHVKNIRVSSISGGSDIISCFALGNPMLPVYRGELQCIGLGMDVKIYNSNGQPVIDEKGELVCTKPFPSMPVSFWNDPKGEKYQHAYFDKFPNVWTHGDYALINQHGGVIIYGRSDATLNPRGVRIGSAEIYQQIEKIPEIIESLVVGQKFNEDERIILFVMLQNNHTLDQALIKKIKSQIKDNTSPHHVPAKIFAVPDIPRTANGKLSEIAVKKIINGEQVDNIEALANPECLKYFQNIHELR